MCDYTGRHFGASYEDACCIDGYLWDADSGDENGLTRGGDLPCPACNTEKYLDDAKTEAEETAWGQSMNTVFSGAMILEGALRRAEQVNPEEASKWKLTTGKVHTFDWPDRAAVLAGRASPDRYIELTVAL